MGARPGRPRLLLVLSAALLASTLALAWFQVHHARALGPRQSVGDTPITVRLPRGWQRDSEYPNQFLLPVREPGANGRPALFERRIRVELEQKPTFTSVDLILRERDLAEPGELAELARTRIGPYPAVEVHKFEPLRIGRLRLRREVLIRFTCLPDGRVLRVRYEPLAELRPADQEILDEVCGSVELNDPRYTQPPAQLLQRAGLRCAADPAWFAVAPAFDEVAGLYLGGPVDGVPGWSIGVFRTWLALGRTAADVLADVAANQWYDCDIADRLRASQRPDGIRILALRHREIGAPDVRLPAVWLVEQAPDRAVLLFVYAGPGEAAIAEEVARHLATSLELDALPQFADLAAAERAGQRLVRELGLQGPRARWGRESIESLYAGDTPFGVEAVRATRQARNRDPRQGYEGEQQRWLRAIGRSAPLERLQWTLSGRAETYEWLVELDPRWAAVQRVRESRQTADGEVARQVVLARGPERSWTYRPGPGFVPRPAESIIAGWVARDGDSPAVALVEVSSLLGPGACTQLLRRLPPEGGLPRVLVQEDCWPVGTRQTFDDDRAEAVYEETPAGRYERVEPPATPRGHP